MYRYDDDTDVYATVGDRRVKLVQDVMTTSPDSCCDIVFTIYDYGSDARLARASHGPECPCYDDFTETFEDALRRALPYRSVDEVETLLTRWARAFYGREVKFGYSCHDRYSWWVGVQHKDAAGVSLDEWEAWDEGEVYGIVVESKVVQRITTETLHGNGEVLYHEVETVETWQEEDSCWGCYGRKYAEEEAQSWVESLKEDEVA